MSVGKTKLRRNITVFLKNKQTSNAVVLLFFFIIIIFSIQDEDLILI